MNEIQKASIKEELHTEKEAKSMVIKAIKAFNSPVKQADIVIKTGLSVYKVEDTLEELMTVYPCRLKVDKEGNLIYLFDLKHKINKGKSLLTKLLSAGKNFLKFSFKGWIVIMMIFYFTAYLPFIIYITPYFITTLLLGLVPSSLIALIYSIISTHTSWFKNFTLDQKIKNFFLGEKLYFYKYDKLGKNILTKVFSYVFGQKKSNNLDKLELEKRILGYINKNERKITISDLIALTGWSISKAETEATQLMINYHGEVYVTQEGIIIYHFPRIDSKLLENTQINSPFIWNNLIAIKNWNNNYSFENGLITLTNLFVLIASATLMITGEKMPWSFFPESINIHLIPFLFSSSFFTVSIIGKLRRLKINRQHIKKNKYFNFLKLIFKRPKTILHQPNNNVLDYTCISLEANFNNDKEGDVYCSFDRIEEELKTVQRERGKTNENLLVTYESDYKKEEPSNTPIKISKYIKYIAKPDGLTLYLKQSVGNNGIINMFLYFSLAFVMVAGIIKFPLMVLFLGPAAGVAISKFWSYFASFVNATIVTFEGPKVNVKSGPLPFSGKNKSFSLFSMDHLSVKPHGFNYHKLLMGTSDDSIAFPLIKFVENKRVLWKLDELIKDYMHKMMEEYNYDR